MCGRASKAVERAVARLYPMSASTWTAEGPAGPCRAQDLDEMLGNLIENAAKYGGGSVFVTVGAQAGFVEFLIEDDGRGIPEEERIRIFDRGVRLDTGKPGTGLGLAIVRDVAEIYEGTVSLEESEDLGGLLVAAAAAGGETQSGIIAAAIYSWFVFRQFDGDRILFEHNIAKATQTDAFPPKSEAEVDAARADAIKAFRANLRRFLSSDKFRKLKR
jgi:hypothetical protein